MSSITDPLIGTQLGDYRIEDILGRGGMARVYRGFDAKLERYAAVKVIDAYLTSESEEEYRQRFQREARAIAKLNHPRIVGVYQFGQKDSLYYMAMAFIEGRDLGQILKEFAQQGKAMAYRDVLRVMRDIAGALDHAHAGGVIHRDVKPSNIMITPDGHAVLTDFGLALSVPEGSIGNTFGSAHYIAPEQAISSANAVPQSDFYSLGVVLYQMLAGKVPFDDPSAMSVALKHLSDPPPPPRLFNPSLTPQIEAVMMKLLEKEPARRFENGGEFIRALEAAFSLNFESGSDLRGSDLMKAVINPPSLSKRPTTHSPTEVSQIVRPHTDTTESVENSKSKPVMVAVIVALLVLVGIGAALMMQGFGGDGNPTPTVAQVADSGGGGALAAATEDQTEAAPTETSEPTGRAVVVGSDATESATSEAESTDAAAAGDATESATDEAAENTPASAEETDAPTATRTPRATRTSDDEPTNTPRASQTPERSLTPEATDESAANTDALVGEPGVIVLYYDEIDFMIYNPSDSNADVSYVEFTRQRENGNPLTLRTTVWADAWALRPQACFHVFGDSYMGREAPERCGERQGWRAVSFIRWFWISDDPDTTFEVRRFGELVTTCRVGDGECIVDLREDEDAEADS